MAEEAPEYPEPRFYSREFKLEAVPLSESSKRSMAQIARDLGVPERVLYRWPSSTRRPLPESFHTPPNRGQPHVPIGIRSGLL